MLAFFLMFFPRFAYIVPACPFPEAGEDRFLHVILLYLKTGRYFKRFLCLDREGVRIDGRRFCLYNIIITAFGRERKGAFRLWRKAARNG